MDHSAARSTLRSQLQASNPNVEIVQDICRDVLKSIPFELRPQIWQLILGVNTQDGLRAEEDMDSITEDMSNQRVIRVDAARTRADREEFRRTEVQAVISKLLTFYCKEHEISYKQGLNEVLAPFMLLRGDPIKVPRGMCYSTFDAFVKQYMTHMYSDMSFVGLQCEFRIFRLLLQYHDPELCSYLDSHLLSPELYATPWFLTHFARNVPIELLMKLWDTILLIKDKVASRTFHIFTALAFLCTNRKALLKAHASDLPILLAGSLASNSLPDSAKRSSSKDKSSNGSSKPVKGNDESKQKLNITGGKMKEANRPGSNQAGAEENVKTNGGDASKPLSAASSLEKQPNAVLSPQFMSHTDALLHELRGLHDMETTLEIIQKACGLFDMTPRCFVHSIHDTLFGALAPANSVLEALEALDCLQTAPNDVIRAADDDLHAGPVTAEELDALESSSVVADLGLEEASDPGADLPLDWTAEAEAKCGATEVLRSTEDSGVAVLLEKVARANLRASKQVRSGTLVLDCRPREAVVRERLECPMVHHVDPALSNTPDNLGFVLVQIATFAGEGWEAPSLEVCGWSNYSSLCPRRAQWGGLGRGAVDPWAQPAHWHTAVVADEGDAANIQFAQLVVQEMVRLGCKRVSRVQGGWSALRSAFHGQSDRLQMRWKEGGMPPPPVPLPGEQAVAEPSSWIQRLMGGNEEGPEPAQGEPKQNPEEPERNDTAKEPERVGGAAVEGSRSGKGAGAPKKRRSYFGSLFSRKSSSEEPVPPAASCQTEQLLREGWEPFAPVQERFKFEMEFYCDLLLESGESVPCILGLSKTQVVRAAIHPEQPDAVRVESVHPMTTVAKITSRKSRKNLAVFHFSKEKNTKRESYLFYKGRARECIEFVKMQYAAAMAS